MKKHLNWSRLLIGWIPLNTARFCFCEGVFRKQVVTGYPVASPKETEIFFKKLAVRNIEGIVFLAGNRLLYPTEFNISFILKGINRFH